MLNQILNDCNPYGAQLVAVSKTKPIGKIQELYDQGQRIFGENRVQELVEKHDALPKDIDWHMIGHLQKNKVKYIAPFVSLIHSVDSLSLLQTINKEGKKNNRVIPILLQHKIATEETKFGSDVNEIKTIVEEANQMENIEVHGVMGMATFTDDMDQVRSEFKLLKSYFDQLKSTVYSAQESFGVVSMGMSGDYKIALEEGSTMIRVGSLLFGSRY